MLVNTNLSDFDPKSFDPIPDGYYEAEVANVTHEKASTGTAYLNVEFAILGPTHEGRHVWANVFLTEKARWKLAALLNATGIGMVDDLDTDQLIGNELRIRVKQVDDSFGDTRSEVVGFRKLKSDDGVPF